ncbi:branched-chain amino acid transporter permease [Corynebacterium pacaense]|uniref:branched-chain amino acid transporter permease n=1 Tax=Corynebacterium pacaense TaxID=1816684 RepID=UPI0009BB648C|nr:AzlD domain-containing protein [Corynebacterium pacaense]
MGEHGLPEGVSLYQVAAVLIPVAIITVVLRFIPFVAVRKMQGSELMSMLGRTMPVGVMSVLVIYTLFSSSSEPGGVWASLAAVAVTVALHWWRGSAALSIIGGTVAYMVLVNLVVQPAHLML